jgi:hypothetical protein
MNEEAAPQYQPQPAAPAPVQMPAADTRPSQVEPSVPVVKVYSVRGVEYGLMTFMVHAGAAGLIWCLLALVNGEAGFDSLAFPVAVLLSALPVFGYLFLRLRKAELADPKLRFEPSKRRWSQLTQFITFFACFFNLVGFIYTLVSKMGGDDSGSLAKSFGSFDVVLVVAGGVIAYYCMDEHRNAGRAR